MDCDKIKELLSAYIDNQLSENERSAVEKHLDACPSCRDYRRQLEMLGALADRLELGGSEEYWQAQYDAILDRIERPGREDITDIRPERRSGSMYKILAVAASVVLVALVSINEFENIDSRRSLFKSGREIHQAAPAAVPVDSGVTDSDLMTEKSVAPEPAAVEYSIPKPAPAVSPVNNIAEEAPREQLSSLEPPPGAKSKRTAKAAAQDKIAIEPEPVSEGLNIGSDRRNREKPPISTPAEMSTILPSGGDDYIPPSPDTSSRELKISTVPQQTGEALTKSIRVMEAVPAPDEAMLDAFTLEKAAGPDSSAYFSWKKRADSLDNNYGDILSPHYIESAGKGRRQVSLDSLEVVRLQLAEAFYQVGRLTADNKEKETMIARLRQLRRSGGDRVKESVNQYLDDLEQPRR